jgi:hypothetical protein
MATGTYSIPLYHSAVDGLATPIDKDRQKFITKRRHPIMPPPIRTSYMPQSYPIHSNLVRSSTGSMLHRVPNPRTTTMLRPMNIRWDSAINIVDFKTRPLVHQKRSVQNQIILTSGRKLLRSESMQITNMNLVNNGTISKTKIDARHFCGLAPIQENKLLIREIPPFRPSGPMSR